MASDSEISSYDGDEEKEKKRKISSQKTKKTCIETLYPLASTGELY